MDRITEMDIESRCGHLQSQNGSDVPNWLPFTSFLVIVISKSFEVLKLFILLKALFLSILCAQGTTLKVLFKVINEHLLLLLESGFSGH